MATINVSGLPRAIKFNKMIFLFKGFFKKVHIKNFWIREIADIPGGDLQEATVELETENEAYDAHGVLDNLYFNYQGQCYPLTATINKIDGENRRRRKRESPFDGENHSRRKMKSPFDGEHHSRRRQLSRRDRRDRDYHERYDRSYRRERSMERPRSPLYQHKSSELDLEIQLLRKQRLVIEEERRLLLERKKLELMKEYGPSFSEDLNYERSRSRERRYSPKRTYYRPWPNAPPTRRAQPISRAPPIRRKFRSLPAFVLPCKNILDEMMDTINSEADKKYIPLLVKLIRSKLRKRIAIILENKDHMPTPEIVKLYRDTYPIDTDIEFIQISLKSIKYIDLPEIGANEKVTKEQATYDEESKDFEDIEADETPAGAIKIDEDKVDTDDNSEVMQVFNGSEDEIEDIDKSFEAGDENDQSLHGTDTELSIIYSGNIDQELNEDDNIEQEPNEEDKVLTADNIE